MPDTRDDSAAMPPSVWQPTCGLPALLQRSEFIWRLRHFFHDHQVAEVQTPILCQELIVDRHIDPVVLPGSSLGLSSHRQRDFYLQSSPEYGMKRLLAAGLRDIYQIGPVFRAGERGQFHNPEFTMVEWYRSGHDLQQAVGFLADMIRVVLGGPVANIESYQSAFQRLAQLDPLNCTTSELAEVAGKLELGTDSAWSDNRDDWLDLLFSLVVQPQLGWQQPTIITHYPASQSALAQIYADDPRTAERFELFIKGVELANGYHELLDPVELERRSQLIHAQRAADGKPPLAGCNRLLRAMQDGLPACSGCALGFDRLLMVAMDATAIDEVLAFPIEIA